MIETGELLLRFLRGLLSLFQLVVDGLANELSHTLIANERANTFSDFLRNAHVCRPNP